MWPTVLVHRMFSAGVIALCALIAFPATPLAFGVTNTVPGAIHTVRSSTNWMWPIEAPHPLVRTFEAPETAYSVGHRGIDIGATGNASVRAPADGIIHFSGFVVNRHLVSVDHGNGVLTSFEPVLSHLTEGTFVRKGDPIGVLQSGHCSTPCLHFGVRRHGQYVSPLNFLGGLERSVLLPTREIR